MQITHRSPGSYFFATLHTQLSDLYALSFLYPAADHFIESYLKSTDIAIDLACNQLNLQKIPTLLSNHFAS